MPTVLQSYFGSRTVVPPSGAATRFTLVGGFNTNDAKVGSKNSKWRDQVAAHENATTGYSREFTRRKVIVPTAINYSKNGPTAALLAQRTETYIEGDALGSVLPSLGILGSIEARGVTKFLKKCKRTQMSSSAFVALGELRETIHAFRHPIESLRAGFLDYSNAVVRNSKKAARSTRKGRPRLARNIDDDLWDRGVLLLGKKRKRPPVQTLNRRRDAIANAITGTYLEYANGWRPLALEVEKQAEALSRYMYENRSVYKTVKSTLKEEFPKSVSQTASSNISEWAFRENRVASSFNSCRIKGEISYTLGESSLYTSLGLGWLDAAASLWELMPLSYVADWFLPVGDILEAAAFNQRDLAWCCETLYQKGEVQGSGVNVTTLNPTTPNGIRTVSGQPGVYRMTRLSWSRKIPSLSVPSLVRFELPESYLISKLCNVSSIAWNLRSSSRQINRLLNG